MPARGSLEMVDELKVMHHFFGEAIFQSMVFAATNAQRKQKLGWDDEDNAETTRVLRTALQSVTGNKDIFVPPIVYIPFDATGEDILTNLKTANVGSAKGMGPVKFRDDVCAKCSVQIRYVTPPGSTQPIRDGVINSKGDVINYEDSMCHSQLVSRLLILMKCAKYVKWDPNPKDAGKLGMVMTTPVTFDFLFRIYTFYNTTLLIITRFSQTG